jgi:hypothetical protein
VLGAYHSRAIISKCQEDQAYLFRRKTKPLSLETGDSGPRQSTVTDPTVGMGSAVTSRHPSKELSVINDKVGEGELMRVEEEWSDTKTENGNPEVDDVGDKDRHGDVEQEDQSSNTKIDGRASESRADISTCLKSETGDLL